MKGLYLDAGGCRRLRILHKKLMMRQKEGEIMGCKYATFNPDSGRWDCSVSGDGCMYLTPNSKRCAEDYGEGPDVNMEQTKSSAKEAKMEYNYFVSYLSIRKARCGYGNCLITLDHEINSMKDIRAIEKGLNADATEKGFKGAKYSVVSYQLLNSYRGG